MSAGPAPDAPPLSAATARGLATLALAAVVYASLYPFEAWRSEVPQVQAWLLAPWPRYWTAMDLWVNWLGYVPLGMALALAFMRERVSWSRVLLATLGASVLSAALESLQSLMVHRVASNLDWAFNTLGAGVGAVLVHWGLRSPWRRQWLDWRRQHLLAGAGLFLSVLLFWLLLLPLPAVLPFAVGRLPPEVWAVWQAQVGAWLRWAFEALGAAHGAWPWRWAEWPLFGQVVALSLLLLTPMALLRWVWAQPVARALAAWLLLGLAVLVPTCAHLLMYGLDHAGDWLLPPVVGALGVAAVLAPLWVNLPQRVLGGLALVLALVQWGLVNALAETSVWALQWQSFEQGRFVRWYGLLTWWSVLWPGAVFALLLRVFFLSRR